MAKLILLAVLVAFVAVTSAASLGGVKDWVGNYYDFTTGQYASAVTGKVYDTVPAPAVYTAPVAPYVAAAPVAPYVAAAPYYYGGYPYHYVYK